MTSQWNRASARALLPDVLTPDDYDAIVFDMGGVFLVPNPVSIGDALRLHGVDVDLAVDAAADAHYAGIRGITELLATQEVEEADLDVWLHYDQRSMQAFGLDGDALGGAVEARGRARRQGTAVHNIWNHTLDHNIEAFHRISASFTTAIVSNNDGTAIDQCRRFGICQLEAGGPLPQVPVIIDSTTVAVAKPDPAIFTPALDVLGTDPARTLYIGDTVHADVLGAGRAGMPVVQLDPLDLHADHDHHRLPDVVALAEVLGA
jgi:phosphoglycolate phosphatase-like HAD superfamily hydrolase